MADLKTKNVRATDIELKDKLVAINRVTKVTKGGRHFSFSAIVVVGSVFVLFVAVVGDAPLLVSLLWLSLL